ncbi:aspC [Symbiodinium sp. CCMP2592]|nr:aspC [Symbiodinium sp. CCMP2592]
MQDSKDESPALCVAQMKKLDDEDNEVLAAVEPSQETAEDKAPSPSTETRKLQDEDSQKLAPSVPSQEAENGGEQDSDDEFHSAFMAEMRRLHGEDRQKLNTSGPSGQAMPEWSKDFEASAKFLGARPGFVFKRGRRGLGYYRDLGPFHDPSQERAQASGVLPDFRRSRKAKRPLEEVDGASLGTPDCRGGDPQIVKCATKAEEDMEEKPDVGFFALCLATICEEDPDEAMDKCRKFSEPAQGQGETGTEKVVETKKA